MDYFSGQFLHVPYCSLEGVSALRHVHHKRSEIRPKEDGFKIHSWLFVSGFVVVSSWSLVEEVSDSDQ